MLLIAVIDDILRIILVLLGDLEGDAVPSLVGLGESSVAVFPGVLSVGEDAYCVSILVTVIPPIFVAALFLGSGAGSSLYGGAKLPVMLLALTSCSGSVSLV